MKLIALMSAGLIAAATFAAPASAQMQQEHHDRAVVVKQTRTVHTERHSDYRPHVRRVCKVKYRHHKRIRTCRTVRR